MGMGKKAQGSASREVDPDLPGLSAVAGEVHVEQAAAAVSPNMGPVDVHVINARPRVAWNVEQYYVADKTVKILSRDHKRQRVLVANATSNGLPVFVGSSTVDTSYGFPVYYGQPPVEFVHQDELWAVNFSGVACKLAVSVERIQGE
jgi:hypothetical protein